MMDLYDHYDEELVQLTREAHRPAWWKKVDIEDRGLIGMETPRPLRSWSSA